MWKPQTASLATYPLEPSWPHLRRAVQTTIGIGLLLGSLHLTLPVGSPPVLLGLFVLLAGIDLVSSLWYDRAERRRLLIPLSLPRPAETGVWPVMDLATSAHLRLRLAEAHPDPAWQIGQNATHVFLLTPDGDRWKVLRRYRR